MQDKGVFLANSAVKLQREAGLQEQDVLRALAQVPAARGTKGTFLSLQSLCQPGDLPRTVPALGEVAVHKLPPLFSWPCLWGHQDLKVLPSFPVPNNSLKTHLVFLRSLK